MGGGGGGGGGGWGAAIRIDYACALYSFYP